MHFFYYFILVNIVIVWHNLAIFEVEYSSKWII